MKEKDLLPFDLEEAKKDPSRVRYECKEVTDFHVLSNGSLVFLPVGDNHPVSVFKSINGDWNYFDLRLTPKRRFVKIEQSVGRETRDMLHGPFPSIEDAVRFFMPGKIFELIPVKEDE